MSNLDFDSYTGAELPPTRISSIPGIHIGRSPFYKDAELRRVSAQYHTESCPGGVRVRRAGCPPNFLPVLPALTQARVAMDWCVRNDASIAVAIHWLNKKNVEPYLELLQRFMEAESFGKVIHLHILDNEE